MSPGAALGAMTLGQLIDALGRLPLDARAWVGSGRYNPAMLISYRGYYDDLAVVFGSRVPPCRVHTLLSELKYAIGGNFSGYKGGIYHPDADTAVWVTANQHEAYGNAVVAVEPRPGGYELVVERIDP